MIYESFARFYDELFDGELYRQWQQFVVEYADASVENILDLAGGAGRLGILLSQSGYKVTDFDLAEEMLSLADEHAHEASVDLQLVQGDMRDLTHLPQYDLVTCFADSLCYLASIEELKQVFQQVAAHLGKGKQFFFDMISPYQTDQVYPGYMYNFEAEDQSRAFLWSSFANDEEEHGVIHELTFFVRQDGGQFKRYHETHLERSYELGQIMDALQETGFENIKVTANFGQQSPNQTTTRWFFTCRKG